MGTLLRPAATILRSSAMAVTARASHLLRARRWVNAGTKEMVCSLAGDCLAAIVGISMGCDAEKVADMPTNTSGEIAIIALKEPSLAECEEAFGATATMNVPHAHPSTASVEQIEETIGLFLVPESVPDGLELKARRIGNQVSFTQFESSPEQGQRARVLTIEQGPTNGRVWQLQAKDGHFDRATVRGAPAYIIRGSFVIRARMVKGVETIEGCGWDLNEENSLVFVNNGHAVRIAGSPASDFPPSRLTTLAASLVESPRSQ